MNKYWRAIGGALTIGAVLTPGLTMRAQDAAALTDPIKSVELRLDGQCDEKNSRLWLSNNHDTKAVVATLRWSLAGGKRVITDSFQVAPLARIEVGCAARAEVAEARFVE